MTAKPEEINKSINKCIWIKDCIRPESQHSKQKCESIQKTSIVKVFKGLRLVDSPVTVNTCKWVDGKKGKMGYCTADTTVMTDAFLPSKLPESIDPAVFKDCTKK